MGISQGYPKTGEQLWTGALYMDNTQSVTPSKTLAQCPTGWCLVWSYYNGGLVSSDFNYTFIPKYHADNFSGSGLWQLVGADNSTAILKYLYVTNTTITGYSANGANPQSLAVLRAVISY